MPQSNFTPHLTGLYPRVLDTLDNSGNAAPAGAAGAGTTGAAGYGPLGADDETAFPPLMRGAYNRLSDKVWTSNPDIA